MDAIGLTRHGMPLSCHHFVIRLSNLLDSKNDEWLHLLWGPIPDGQFVARILDGSRQGRAHQAEADDGDFTHDFFLAR